MKKDGQKTIEVLKGQDDDGANIGRSRVMIGQISLSPYPILGAIFFLALVLRLLYVWDVSESAFFGQLVVDQASYDAWAMKIAAGDWLGSATFYQDPLYPYFLAIIYKAFGRSLLLVYILQAIISSAGCLPLYGLGRRVFHDPRVGFLAALFWAGYKVDMFFVAQVLKTSPGLALTITALWLLVKVRDDNTWPSGLLAGIASGLILVFRGNFLLVAPLLFLWIGIGLATREGRKAIMPLAALVIGCVSVLSAVAARNLAVSGELTLTTAQGGVNFWVGNYRENKWGVGRDPDFAIRSPEFERGDFLAEAERRTGKKLTDSQMSRFWFKEGLREIAADPALSAARFLRKSLLTVNFHEVSDNLNYDFFRQEYSFMLRLPLPAFWLAGPFGLAGLALASRRKKGGFLALYLGSYFVTLLLFYVVNRYRAPLVPVLLVFAAYGVIEFARSLRERDRRAMALYLAVLVAAGAIGFPRWRRPSFDVSWQKVGNAMSREGRWAEAIDAYERALSINPGQDVSWIGLGLAYETRGRRTEADAAFSRAVSANPKNAWAHYYLGRSLERGGERDKAREEYERALGLSPGMEPAAQGLRRLSP